MGLLALLGNKCDHDWVKVTEKREKSSLAQSLESINGGSGTLRLLMDTYILVLKCERCGKLDKTIEKV